MTNKLMICSIIPILMLVGCSNKRGQVVGLYEENLTKLIEGPYIEVQARNSINNEHYNIKCAESKTTTNKYLYTIKIDYKNEKFDIRAILLPGSDLSNAKEKNLSYFGYNKDSMYLTATHEDNFHYPSYKLQVEKKDKEKELYVCVSYNNDSNMDLYKINF